MACNSVWSGECDTALAGGMNIVCGASNFSGLSEGHFLSETGGCKTYDNAADGYCRGEAVGSVVVKRLDAAEADNDNILACILSTATNYPDNSVSITHPYGPAQESLYRHVRHPSECSSSLRLFLWSRHLSSVRAEACLKFRSIVSGGHC